MKSKTNFKGQALITLLIFTLIAITTTSAAAIILFTNSQSGQKLQQGIIALEIAKSGAENAMLQLLRNPNYQGEIIAIGDGTATIQVSSNSGTLTIISLGKAGNFTRKVQATGTFQDNAITFSPIKEIYN